MLNFLLYNIFPKGNQRDHITRTALADVYSTQPWDPFFITGAPQIHSNCQSTLEVNKQLFKCPFFVCAKVRIFGASAIEVGHFGIFGQSVQLDVQRRKQCK